MTSLMIAIYFGSSEVVKTEIVDILLRSGADVNITDLVSWYIQLCSVLNYYLVHVMLMLIASIRYYFLFIVSLYYLSCLLYDSHQS